MKIRKTTLTVADSSIRLDIDPGDKSVTLRLLHGNIPASMAAMLLLAARDPKIRDQVIGGHDSCRIQGCDQETIDWIEDMIMSPHTQVVYEWDPTPSIGRLVREMHRDGVPYADIAQAMGVTIARLKQYMSDHTTCPSSRSCAGLREFLETSQDIDPVDRERYRKRLASIESEAKRKLGEMFYSGRRAAGSGGQGYER